MEVESILKPIIRASVQSVKRGGEELERIRKRSRADVASLLVSSQPKEELNKMARRMTASALLGVGGVVSDFAETLWLEKRGLKQYLLAEAGELSPPKEEVNVQSAALLLGQPNDVSGARSRLVAAFDAQPNQAPAIAKGVCLKEAWVPGWLDENRVRVMGTTLAYALAHLGEIAVPSNIENINGSFPEVAVFLESFSAVQGLSCNTPVTVVIPMFGEQAQLPEYIREHIIQLEALRTLNSNFNWRLNLICDGDDRVPVEQARKRSSAEVAKDVMQDVFFDGIRERVSILQLSQEEKERIGSKKGGAVIYGMRHALKNGASYVITNDIDFAIPLLTIGSHLLHLSNDTDITIASRWHQNTIAKRPMIRWGISAIFAGLKASLYPELQHVIDTQVSVKGFTAGALKRILPLSADGKWEAGFDYSLSFDTQILARASIKALKIKEIRTILYWSQTWGAVPASSGIEMGRRLFIQRALLDDELAQAENALARVAGGYNFHVYNRSDIDVVVKIPKMHSDIERLYHRALLEFQKAVSPQTDTKRLWTHGMMSSPLVLQMRQKLPPIPDLLKSALFDAYRLLSPGSDPLAGYRLAAHRLGGLSLEFEIIKDATFRLVKYAKVENVYVHEAIVQQKIDPQNTIGNLINEFADDCNRGQVLIAKAIAFQEKLWRRGVFDRDVTNMLQNLVVIDDKELRLLDPDDLTSDLDEAIAIVEGESPRLPNRVDVQLMLGLRQELGEYYLSELRRLFTPAYIGDVWDTEEPVPVSSPAGEYPLCETTDKVEHLYERLLSVREKRPSPLLRGGDLHEKR